MGFTKRYNRGLTKLETKELTLFGSRVCLHVFMEGRSVNEALFALGALELLDARVGWDVRC